MPTPSFRAFASYSRLIGWLLLASILVTACDALSAASGVASSPFSAGSTADGGDARPLTDTVLAGSVYIFAETGAFEHAAFYLDDAARRGKPARQIAGNAGGEGGSRLSFILDTRDLSDGPHLLTLELTLAAREPLVLHAPLSVGNAAADMLKLVNDARRGGYDCGEEGVFDPAPALGLEPHLLAAAQRQAADMDEHGFLGHTGSDGSTLSARVTDAGYRWSRVGENVAYGQDNVAEVVMDLLESDAHCANILGPDFSDFGAVRVGDHWAQVFGKPQ